jgi:hypothetical protein
MCVYVIECIHVRIRKCTRMCVCVYLTSGFGWISALVEWVVHCISLLFVLVFVDCHEATEVAQSAIVALLVDHEVTPVCMCMCVCVRV